MSISLSETEFMFKNELFTLKHIRPLTYEISFFLYVFYLTIYLKLNYKNIFIRKNLTGALMGIIHRLTIPHVGDYPTVL